ncbi:hypothetical protein PHSC3_000989 [Chlamydiales bacterium STE3]|nr:hypothetical protein PHSC3_000989 [Chlamydiales bacterium STE3]
MKRYALRDDQWERIKDLLPGRRGTVGSTAKDNRLFVEAVLYRYRVAYPGGICQSGLEIGKIFIEDGADLLLPKIQAEIVIADKAFSAEERVILPLGMTGKGIVIPSKNNAKSPRAYDKHLYKTRHLIENFFAKLKQYRGIATRYDKTARNFLSAILFSGLSNMA